MSRAFVSENDSQFEEGEVPALKIPLPPGARNYMTAEGAQAMLDELEALARDERPRLAAQISREVGGTGTAAAPAGGVDQDTLSRLRRRLREAERRIEYLTEMSARLEVVETGGQDPERVAFGATVTVRDAGALSGAPPATAAVETYRIVGVDESDPAKGSISWISPLARALVSARRGETVSLRLPGGVRRLEIVAIEYS